jgi:hypothetical protein
MNLKLLEYQHLIKIRHKENKVEILDSVRNKYLVLTPEEHVRQLFIHFLVQKMHYSKNRISVERALEYNKLGKRFDLLVYDKHFEPMMLIECKSPKIDLKKGSLQQVSTYNQVFSVPYLCVTNGQETFVFKMDYESRSTELLHEFPLPE